MSSAANQFRVGHFVTTRLMRFTRRTERPFTVDEKTHDGRWTELGRYDSKRDAEVAMQRLIADGQALPDALRVSRRPIDTD